MKIIEFPDKGICWLQWPVTLKGCDKPGLHITAKYFGHANVSSSVVKRMVWDLDKAPYYGRDFEWRPRMFAELVYVLELIKYPAAFKDIHDQLDFIYDQFKPWKPHITVPKEYWEKVRMDWLMPGNEDLVVGPLEFCKGTSEE